MVYIGLGMSALSLLLGWGHGGGNGEQSARDWTAWLLAQPFGRWLVGAVGFTITAAALSMAYKAWTASSGITWHLTPHPGWVLSAALGTPRAASCSS